MVRTAHIKKILSKCFAGLAVVALIPFHAWGVQDECGALFYRSGSQTMVLAFVNGKLSRLGKLARPWMSQYPDSAIHTDPLACRFCQGTSFHLRNWLADAFPANEWVVVRSPSQPNLPFFGRVFHNYIYSPDLNLIVDATYRQFFVQLQLPNREFKKLPKVFIGTPEEFRSFVDGMFPAEAIDVYLSAQPLSPAPVH